MKRHSIIAIPSAAGLAIGLLWAVPAQAEPVSMQQVVTVTNASMTWPINACAFEVGLPACTSLTERQELLGDVERAETGWEFFGGDGVVTEAGEMTVSWKAAVQLGNTTRGNYTITLTNPVLTVDAVGNGALSADVTWQLGTTAPETTEDVTVVTFGEASTDADFESTPAAFDSQFTDALGAASGAGFNLASWFTQTGSASDPLKLPGAVSFDRWVPTLTVTLPERFAEKNPRVKAQRFMVSVTGTGFDPAVKANPAVQGMYLVFGPNPSATEDGYTNPDIYFRVRYMPTAPDANGEFTQSIQVRGTYTKAGETYNGRFREPLGVGTWAAHRNASPEWQSFTQIRFRR